MKTSHIVVGVTVAGLLAGFLGGCASHHAGDTAMEFGMGPMVVGGVTNYPAKPGATYSNVPVEYTTNPPAAGAGEGVTVITTNRTILIRSVDPVAVPK